MLSKDFLSDEEGCCAAPSEKRLESAAPLQTSAATAATAATGTRTLHAEAVPASKLWPLHIQLEEICLVMRCGLFREHVACSRWHGLQLQYVCRFAARCNGHRDV